MSVVNISTYRFVSIPLESLEALRVVFLENLTLIGLKGTVILSSEGINIGLAGRSDQIQAFRDFLENTPVLSDLFSNLAFKESYSNMVPFGKLKIKIKKQLVPGGDERSCPLSLDSKYTAEYLSPSVLKQWLEEKKDFILLDTRNSYEFERGSFKGAVHYDLERFNQIEAYFKNSDSMVLDKPVVTFCTGGIRCERGAPLAKVAGFKNVYQLDGGILKYFEECGGAFWRGDCFVFDDRVALTPELKPVFDLV